MKWLCSFFFVALTMGFATQAHAWTVSDSEEPGSVLVFPKFIRGFVFTPDQGSLPVTTLDISVTCPNGASCLQGQSVLLRAHWVCAGDPNTSICAEADFNLSTTVKGTVVFDAEGSASPLPPTNCNQGYLIVWAIDGSGNPIKFDGLTGHAVIRTSATSARSHNAVPIQAGDSFSTGDQTAADTGGSLAFDGTHYQQVTGKIYGSVDYQNNGFPGGRTDLTLLTLDVFSNQPNALTSAALRFYDQFENLLSAGTNFTCWEEVSLTDINPSLTSGVQGPKGLVESDPAVQGATPVTMIGLIDTEEDFANPISITGPVRVTVPSNVIAALCTVTLVGTPPAPVLTCRSLTETVTGTLASTINLKREYAHPLLNDSNPVPTTFVP